MRESAWDGRPTVRRQPEGSAGPIVNNVYAGTLDKYTGAQCISCAYVAPTLIGNDGTITITFTSAMTANVVLPGGRRIQIQRYFRP